jgi:hypothetical protein
MSVLKIKNENGEWQGVTSIKGEQGEAGVSPDITVYKNDRKTYQLKIDTKARMFTTPNLKANESAYIGNTDGELGVIDNWFDPEGHRVGVALSELPQLPRLPAQYATRYCFDHPVVMYTMEGEPNDQDIFSWEDYDRHEGTEITVQPNGQEYLNDYIIYDARPKYEWDTWEEKQLMEKVNGYPDMMANWDKYNDKYVHPGCPFQPGDWNWINGYMVDANEIPAVCDVGLLNYGTPRADGTFGDGTEMELDVQTPPLYNLVRTAPAMKNGIWMNMAQYAEGNCCGEEKDWGITKILNHAKSQPANREAFPKEMSMVLVSESDINKATDADGNNMFKGAEKHMGIMVALSPSKYYTIESLGGQVAIFSPCAGFTNYTGEQGNLGKYVTKVKKDLYETRVETITISRREETQIIGATTTGAQGKVPVGQDKVLGTTLMYYVNEDPAYVGRAEVPAVLRTPHKVIEKGEHCTFRIGNTYQEFAPNYWGVYLFCWNEEDYSRIKITEGIEPYSVLESERIASGATKFNMKVKFGDEDDGLGDPDASIHEWNIRLVDDTDNGGYVRYSTKEIKKSYDLDEFSLVGHHHELDDIIDIEELSNTIPKMELSTVSLADGVSPLEENSFYFVYDEGE